MAPSECKKLQGYDFWKKRLNSCKYILAPMVDHSELAWRILSRRYGAQLCYSPMYHASVFCKDARYREEALQTCEDDKPLIIQFCANDPDVFLEAAKLAEDRCDGIDLNLGCPQAIAKKGHYGAFLQDEWELVSRLVKTVHENVKVPISCKIRIFTDIDKTVAYAQMLEHAGAQLLTVHGRTREQRGPETGVASWAHIKAVKSAVNIPVFANGNIQYPEDVQRCLDATRVDGVMIAEGNLHNPALFAGLTPPTWKMAFEYLNLVAKYPCPLSFVRGHLFKLFYHTLQIYSNLRDAMATAKSIEELHVVTSDIKAQCLKDEDMYMDENRSDFLTEFNIPHWLCQPYIRVKPNSSKRNSAASSNGEQVSKRQIEVTENGVKLSLKKLKRLRRNPHLKFSAEKGRKFSPCNICRNPKGVKCVFSLCKPCCRKKTYHEILDCCSHGFMMKTRRSKLEADDHVNVLNNDVTDLQEPALELCNNTELSHHQYTTSQDMDIT